MRLVIAGLVLKFVSGLQVLRSWIESDSHCVEQQQDFLLHVITDSPSPQLNGHLIRNGDNCESRSLSEQFTCLIDHVQEVSVEISWPKWTCHLRTDGETEGSVGVCFCWASNSCDVLAHSTFFIASSTTELASSAIAGCVGDRLIARALVSSLGTVSIMGKNFLVIGDVEGYISIVDPRTGEHKKTLMHVQEDLLVRSLSGVGNSAGLFASTVDLIASNAEGWLVTCGSDYRIVAWTPNFQEAGILRMQYSIEKVVFRDMRLLVALSSGKVEIHEIGLAGFTAVQTFFVGCWVTGLVWVEFPRVFAVACSDGQLQSWSVDNAVVPVFTQRQADGFLCLEVFDLNDGSKIIISADAAGAVQSWSASSGAKVDQWKVREGANVAVPQSIGVWGSFLVARTKESVHVFDLADTEDGFWESISLTNLTSNVASSGVQFNWRPARQGSANNNAYVNRTVSGIEFHACNVPGTSDCGSGLVAASDVGDAPIVEANFLLPFEFTRIKGELRYEPVVSAGVVEDCRPGQRPISRWNDNFKNLWSLIEVNKYPSSGCQLVDFSLAPNMTSSEDCKAECSRRSECNAVHVVLTNDWSSVVACELQRCADFLNVAFSSVSVASGSVHQFWGYTSGDLGGAVAATTGGFIGLGTREQVVYGGCGPKVAEGLIVVTETELIESSNSLRIQVSQVRKESSVRVVAVHLEVFRSSKSSIRMIVDSSHSRDIDMSRDAGTINVASRYTADNFAVSNGLAFGSVDDKRVAVWDLRGLSMTTHIELASSRIAAGETVDAEFEYRAELGEVFDLVVRAPSGTFWRSETPMVLTRAAYCGAPGSHEIDAAVFLGERSLVGEEELRFKDSVIEEPGEYLVCFCLGSCCNSPARYAGNVAGKVTVAGPLYRDNDFVCMWSKVCEIKNFAGVSLSQNDTIALVRLSDDPSERVVCGESSRDLDFPTDGFLFARTDGTYFRTDESTTDAVEVGNPSLTGRVYLLCWCRGGSGRCGSNDKNYKILAGTLTLVRFDVNPAEKFLCHTNAQCIIKLKSTSGPAARGDLLMVKQSNCTDAVPVAPIGNQGRSRVLANDGILDFSFGVISDQVKTGEYNLCWCEGSRRSCKSAADFSTEIGQKLLIEQPEFIFPNNCATDFTRWRTPWSSTDDCCCNFKEAGANPGCEESGYVRDACFDSRYVLNL